MLLKILWGGLGTVFVWVWGFRDVCCRLVFFVFGVLGR